jgi:hypothetical protein
VVTGKGVYITLQSQCHLFLHGIFQSVILKIPTFVFCGLGKEVEASECVFCGHVLRAKIDEKFRHVAK